MGGVAGIDMQAALRLAEIMGYDLRAMAELLPACESGLVAAVNKRNPDEQS